MMQILFVRKKWLILCAVTALILSLACYILYDEVSLRSPNHLSPVYSPVTVVEQTTTTNTENPVDQGNLARYTNRIFKYELRYPDQLQLNSIDFGKALEESRDVVISNSKSPYEHFMRVEIPTYKESKVLLKEFAELIWRKNDEDNNPNIPNKQVGELRKVYFEGEPAYQFSLTGSYIDAIGDGSVLYGQHEYLLTEHSGSKFIIGFSTERTFKEIFDSFRFVD